MSSRFPSGRFRRFSASHGRSYDSPPLFVETPSPQAVRQRDLVFRRSLVTADVLAGLFVVGLVEATFGANGPGTAALVSYALGRRGH